MYRNTKIDRHNINDAGGTGQTNNINRKVKWFLLNLLEQQNKEMPVICGKKTEVGCTKPAENVV
jgi:hypothetical protein